MLWGWQRHSCTDVTLIHSHCISNSVLGQKVQLSGKKTYFYSLRSYDQEIIYWMTKTPFSIKPNNNTYISAHAITMVFINSPESISVFCIDIVTQNLITAIKHKTLQSPQV